MFTISLTTILETAEKLARNTLQRLYAAWSASNVVNEIISVPYSTTTALAAAYTYVIQADPLAPMVVGWVFNANTVEIPLNQLTVVAPPATPYLRNTSTDATSTPVPVRVVAFS